MFVITAGEQLGEFASFGTRVPLYAEEACETAADVLALDGSALPTDSGIPYVMIGDDLRAERFLFPNVTDPVVYTRVNGGDVHELHPEIDPVIDDLRVRVEINTQASGHIFGSVLDTELTGTAHPVTSRYGALMLERCIRAYVTVEIERSGEWTTCTLSCTATGVEVEAAHGPGLYSFEMTGATQVRATGTVSQGENSAWTGALWGRDIGPAYRQLYSPSPATPATSAIMNLGRFGFVPHPTTADMVYGYAGSTVVRSTNGGSTYATLFTAPTTIQRVQRPANGRLLAFCDNGQVYRADANDANFTSVHTAETPGAANSSSFGYDEYGDIIVYAEYGPNNAADQARRCYQSDDGGATWRKIFEGPQNNGSTVLTWHTHDVRYDPYEDLVWVVNGDGPANANAHFRKRSTSGFAGWTKMWADGECPSQFTTVVPLPSCVLFLSDNFHQSIWRYDRRTRGITNVTPTTELAQTVEDYRSPEPISTNPFVDRSGPVHAAYFGWIVNTANTKIVHLYGTADGLTFHQLWTSPRAPLNEGQADTFYGVFGASAPDSQGRLLIDYRDRVLGQSPGNLIKMAQPSWVAD